jgi:hypothetical protein
MFCRMRRWRKEILVLVDMRFCVFDALCKRFGACLVGDDGPPPAARVHNNQILSPHNSEDRGGDDSEGDNEGGKGDGGRGYKDDGNDGDDDAKRRQTQQSDIKPTSTARNVVATAVRATTKVAWVTVAGATRTTATTVTMAAMAATMTPNCDIRNNKILSRYQWRGTWW